MRTTITIEDDVAARIKKLQKKFPRKTFKEIVNQTLRRGLATAEPAAEPFVIKPVKAKPHGHLNFDNIGKLLETVEGPGHK